MNKFFLLVFVLAGSLLRSADAQDNNRQVCEAQCVEDVLLSCDDFLDQYTLQGSCCSLQKITGYSGCRVRVGYGNCYWYPKCGECPGRQESIWQGIKCGLAYEGAQGTECPASEYPTNWKTPNEGVWNDYSCSPSAAPVGSPTLPQSASASVSVSAIALFGMIVAVAQM